MPVTCDIDGRVDAVTFPTVSPVVMSVARTFWEKATATHVYCDQVQKPRPHQRLHAVPDQRSPLVQLHRNMRCALELVQRRTQGANLGRS